MATVVPHQPPVLGVGMGQNLTNTGSKHFGRRLVIVVVSSYSQDSIL